MCTHLLDLGKNCKVINCKNMSTILQPHYKDHDSQGHPSSERWNGLVSSRTNFLAFSPKHQGSLICRKGKKSPSKPLKSGSSSHAFPIGKSLAALSISKLPETSSPYTLEPQPSNSHSQSRSSIPHTDKMMTLMEVYMMHLWTFKCHIFSQ